MEFRVLGALDIRSGGSRLDLGGLTRRAVLGYLLLHDNQAVSAIRKTLGDGDGAVLLTENPGYRLRVDPDAVDLNRFRRFAEQGRSALLAGAADPGRECLRAAVGMWSGAALADLVEAGIDWNELTALEDERLNVYEDCLEAELAVGRHREITPELEMLTATAPLREGFHRQYMLALYRSGRQAEALRVYHRSRATLVEHLGIEPGRDLRRLHRLILAQDSCLQSRQFRPTA
ncbi:AfsR/SARP family transcriptional regulator [Nocardia crassostreae]|uniref:AfsR/SARP family transcriptional regulator n=1 Tax=Nocardia crassostreae TaxID=53428 RepID=UPI00082AA871|nr:AfsR/SARP family transcriptional regulator [Nocardia crassostreae]